MFVYTNVMEYGRKGLFTGPTLSFLQARSKVVYKCKLLAHRNGIRVATIIFCCKSVYGGIKDNALYSRYQLFSFHWSLPNLKLGVCQPGTV